MYMEVNLLLKDDQVFVHLDLHVMPSSLNFGLQLHQLFLLCCLKGPSLLVCVFLPQFFDSFSFKHFEFFQLFAVVHGFFNALVDSDQLLCILHLFEFWSRLDLSSFDSSVQFRVQHFHGIFVV